MSAFQVSEKHIEYLVNAARQFDQIPNTWHPKSDDDLPQCSALAVDLWNTNAKSVAYRYDEMADILKTWRLIPNFPTTAIQALKAIHCYIYQACEHPGWKTSDAKRFCDRLEARLVVRVPGYDDAEWSL